MFPQPLLNQHTHMTTSPVCVCSQDTANSDSDFRSLLFPSFQLSPALSPPVERQRCTLVAHIRSVGRRCGADDTEGGEPSPLPTFNRLSSLHSSRDARWPTTCLFRIPQASTRQEFPYVFSNAVFIQKYQNRNQFMLLEDWLSLLAIAI